MLDPRLAPSVSALADAWRGGTRLAALPAGAEPVSTDEAYAIQDSLIERLGERVGGWKVANAGGFSRGAVFARRLHASPAVVSPHGLAPLGIEGEIAFRLERALPAREHDYSRAEVCAAVRPLAAIEIVSCRFENFADTPVVHKLADFMSNGGLVTGTPRDDWQGIDFASIPVRLSCDGAIVVETNGGHVAGDPVGWLVTLANDFRRSRGLAAGEIVTAGTYTGLSFAEPGQAWRVEFAGFAPVEVRFTA